MIMCRMTRPSGNLQRAGVTGHTLTRTVSDLLRSRRPFGYRSPRLGFDKSGHRSLRPPLPRCVSECMPAAVRPRLQLRPLSADT
jgi:hypothetical protein